MYSCEFCKWKMDDLALYCSRCGSRKTIEEEVIATSLTAQEDQDLADDESKIPTQPLSHAHPHQARREEPAEAASRVLAQQPYYEHVTSQPLAAYDAEASIHTIVSDQSNLLEENEEEEDDDDKLTLPFMPPWSYGAGSNVPVQVSPFSINPVPAVTSPPQIPTGAPFHPPIPHQMAQTGTGSTLVSPRSTGLNATSPVPTFHFPSIPRHHHTQKMKLPHARPTCLMIVIIGILAICIIAAIITLWPKNPTVARVHLEGLPQRGGHIIIHGDHFAPGTMVTIVVDPPQQGSTTTNLVLGLLHFSADPSHTGVEVTSLVASDGTFEAPFFIPLEWPDGSQHAADVYDQANKLVKALEFILPSQVKQFGLHGCSNDASPVTLGPVQAGSTQAVSKVISLCREGTGQVNWKAHWEPKWLQMDPAGQLNGQEPGQLMLKALPNDLPPGSYTTTITFSSQQSEVKVERDVIFLVMKKIPASSPTPGSSISPPATPSASTGGQSSPVLCIAAAPQVLSFDAMEKQNNTLYAKLALTNCGDTGVWGATTTTSWLKASSTSGLLPSGKIRELLVTASSANLTAGKHTGQMTVSIGSSSVNITVLFMIHPLQQPTPCLNSDKQVLVFNGIIGESAPPAQYAKLANCGATGHISALQSTNDGRNWLGVSVPHGSMSTGDTQLVTIGVTNAVFVQGGTYKGKITFSTGSKTVTINVIFNVGIPCMSVPTKPLIFTTIEGQDNPPARLLPLVNCGIAANWYGAPIVDNGSDWLQIDRSYGYLHSNMQHPITVNIFSKSLRHGIYTGEIVLLIGSSSVSVHVTLIVQQPQKPYCISTNTSELDFTSLNTSDPAPQTLKLGNCGRVGTWHAAPSANWIEADPGDGKLAEDGNQEVSVRLSHSGLALGLHVKTIQFSMGDSTQIVTIKYNVQLPPPVACIKIEKSELNFSYQLTAGGRTFHDSVISLDSIARLQASSSQTISIVNCGDGGILSVQLNSQSETDTSWLHVTLNDRALDAGKSTEAIFTVDTTKISESGLYTANVTFTLTFSQDVTTSKEVEVALSVSPPPSQSPPPVCKVAPSSLSFSSELGGALPPSQTIKLSDCGANDTVTAEDDSGEDLYIQLGGTTFDSTGSQVATVSVIGSTSTVVQHDYTITFETGAGGIVKVPVHWEVHKPTIVTCLNAMFASNSFHVTAGDVVIMNVLFPNCGGTIGTITLDQPGAKWLSFLVDNSGSVNGRNEYDCGSGPAISANIDTTNMIPGLYQSTIQATINTSAGSQTQPVPVNLMVIAPSASPSATLPTPGINTPTDAATETPTIIETDTPTDTPTTVVTATDTPALTDTATATDTPTTVVTDTPIATDTPSTVATATDTPIATDTPTTVATATDTPIATDTPTTVATATDTPVATDTPTAVPPAPTDTPVPPAPTDTPTPVPPAPTPTPVPPAPTDTPTPVPPAPTPTPVPPAPTDTPPPAPTPTP